MVSLSSMRRRVAHVSTLEEEGLTEVARLAAAVLQREALQAIADGCEHAPEYARLVLPFSGVA